MKVYTFKSVGRKDSRSPLLILLIRLRFNSEVPTPKSPVGRFDNHSVTILSASRRENSLW